MDIIFNYQQAYQILDELIIGGYLQETSKKLVINHLKQMEEVNYYLINIIMKFVPNWGGVDWFINFK